MTRVFLSLLLGLTGFHLIIATLLPHTEDELYYWCWSQELQWSYFDHPPMVALLIRCSTEVFGNNLFAIRFPACLGAFFTLLILRRFTDSNRLMGLLLLTPLAVFGSILITPDVPLLFCWASYCWWLTRTHQRMASEQNPQWILGGVILGLGMLSKYPMALAVPSTILSIALLPSVRWSRVFWGLLLQFSMAVLVASPILVHNVLHDFAPLSFQWNHANEKSSHLFSHTHEFLLGQIALMGVGPLLVFGWAIRNFKSFRGIPTVWSAAWLFVLPMSVFLLKSISGRIEANWPVFCYLSIGPIVLEWQRRTEPSAMVRKWTFASFSVPIIVSVVIGGILLLPNGLIPINKDRVGKLVAFNTIKRDISSQFKLLQANGRVDEKVPVYTMKYQTTAMLRFEGIQASQYPIGTRASHFTQTRDHPLQHERMIVICDGGYLESHLIQGFEPPEELGEFPLLIQNQEVSRFRLLEYRRTNSDVAINLQNQNR